VPKFSRLFSVGDGISLGNNDEVGIIYGPNNPSIDGQSAPIGSLFLQSNATWRKVGPKDIDWVVLFGTEYQRTESLNISTTSSNTFQSKLTLKTTPLLGGTYKIEVSYGWFLDSVMDNFEARLLEDGVQLGELHKQEPKETVNQRMYTVRKFFRNLRGSYVYELQYRTDGNFNDPASIFEANIELWRV